MTRIVVTDAAFPGLERERQVASRHSAILEEARYSSAEDLVRATHGARVLLVQFAKITSGVIESLAQNAAIVRYGLGLDNIDLRTAQQRGVRVAYVPDYATGEVADHTVALILASLRKIIPLDRSVRSGGWDPVGTCKPMYAFSDMTVGFIGFGRIGREVQARLLPFGFSTVVFDPYVDVASLKPARAVDLETLLSIADVVTLHAPLSQTTRHIVNESRLRLMKRTSVIVNTARGALLDTPALEQALEEGRIGGAALDVFEEEPLSADSKLRVLPNVILTPHAAWYSAKSQERVQALAADEVDRFLSGRPARCPAPMH
jgi:D-3-phosphoglycerate dehydrogenase / 2-oxoglutarate reductase